MRKTTVAELKQLLEGYPDDAVLVVPTSDHEYREPAVYHTTALYSEQIGVWTEDHGPALTPESEHGKRKNVVVVE